MAGRPKGTPKTGGRKKGTPNKGTVSTPKLAKTIKELATPHAPAALQRIVNLIKSMDERVSLAAAQTILDRAYGRAPQAVTGEGGEGPVTIQIITGVPRADD